MGSAGHGKSVLTKFYKQLTPEQLSSIRVVTGDGAKWITECVNEFTPEYERCVDPFHVVQWAMEALDEVRREVWREAYADGFRNIQNMPDMVYLVCSDLRIPIPNRKSRSA